jgi:D-ribulokinase
MTRRLFLGLDLGTSGVRSSVVLADGREVSSTQVSFPSSGETEVDAHQWWHSAKVCLEQQISALRSVGFSPLDIHSLAIDGTSGSMVLVDERLDPVTPGLMYNSAGFDAEAAVIAQYAEDNSITRGANSALARVLRLQQLDRGGKGHHLCHQADFVLAKLLGRAGISDDNNTLKTGFDPAAETWPAWLPLCGLKLSLLPRVLRVGAAAGAIDPTVAKAMGFSPELVLRTGTTDSIAAFLASGANDIGDAVTSLGTTLAIKLLSSRRIDDQKRGLYSHRLGQSWLVGGASNTGGGVLLDHFDTARIIELSAQIDPSTTSGLDYYPLRAPGERFPVNDPSMKPRLEPRPADDARFLHGMFEGVARIEAQAYAALAQLGAPFAKRIFTTGGGAQNAVWTTIRQRIVSNRIEVAPSSQAAYGMALLCRSVAL